MNRKNEKEKNVLDMLLNILIHQITALYEDLDENKLELFEKNSRCKIRKIQKDKIVDKDGTNLIKNYINYEINEYGYGYDEKESNLRWSLEEMFYDFGSDIAVEARMLRDEWKKQKFDNFKTNINNLNIELDNIKKEKDKLTDKFDAEVEKCNKLSLNIEGLNKNLLESNGQVNFLNNKVESLNKELTNEINKKKTALNEKLYLEENILKLNEKLSMNTEKANSKEVEHLKKGIEILRAELNSVYEERNKQEEVNRNVKFKELETRLDERKKAEEVTNQLTNKINHIEKMLEKEKKNNYELENKVKTLEDNLLRKNNIIDDIKVKNDKLRNQKIKKSIDEAKKEYSKISKLINNNIGEIILNNKTLNGINISQYATQNFSKVRQAIISSQNIEELSKYLLKIIKNLVELQKILIENSIDVNLNELIDMVSKLEEEI